MAKKKDKPQVINNIGEMNLEIDYDKLAEAIVKAQEKSTNDQMSSPCTSTTFSIMISHSFRTLAIVAFPTAILFGIWLSFIIVNKLLVVGIVKYIAYGVSLIVSVLVSYVLGLFAALFWKSAKEIKVEKDKYYIISVFSGLVSFAALVVALVALLKGVG